LQERYNSQPQIYQQFLTLLGNYQANLRSGDPEDRSDLHSRLMTLFKDDSDLLADLRTFMPAIFNAATETAKGGKFKRKNMDALLKKRRRSLLNKQVQETNLNEKQMQFFEKVKIIFIDLYPFTLDQCTEGHIQRTELHQFILSCNELVQSTHNWTKRHDQFADAVLCP
jgi:hypothetical protein